LKNATSAPRAAFNGYANLPKIDEQEKEALFVKTETRAIRHQRVRPATLFRPNATDHRFATAPSTSAVFSLGGELVAPRAKTGHNSIAQFAVMDR
jgi:hypothetical protein